MCKTGQDATNSNYKERSQSPSLANGPLGAELVFHGLGNDSELSIGDSDRGATVEKF